MFGEVFSSGYVRPNHQARISTNRSKGLLPTEPLIMPSFDATVTEIREDPHGGCIVVLQPNELETTTDLKSVLIEPKFATEGGTIHSDRIELHCAERPSIHEG